MFNNSVILNSIYKFLLCLKALYGQSGTSAVLKAVCGKIREMFASSAIVGILRRDGCLVRLWESSFLYRLAEGIINLPAMLHKAYIKAEPVLKESLAFRLVLALTGKLHIAISAFLFVALIIPDRKWYNIYSTAAALGLLLLYIIRQAADGKKYGGLKFFNVFFVIFAICIILSEFTSIFPAESRRFLAFYLTCFLFMLLLAVSIRTPQELYESVGIILLGLGACGAYGFFQKIRGVAIIPSQVDLTLNENLPGRVISTMGNANNFAQVLCILLPFCLAMFLNSKYAISKLFFAALAFPAFVSLLYTSSRSGYVGFAAGLFVFVFLINKKIIPLLFIGGLLCIPLLPDFVYKRLMTITNLSDSSIGYRFKIWKISGQVLRDYWTTGIGLGTDAFVNIVKNYYLGEINGHKPPHSHNLYFQLWLETGILGITTFMGFLLRLFKDSYRSIARAADKRLRNILAAGIASVASILVIGLFEYVWYYPRVMLFFWVAVGLSVAALSLLIRDGEKNSEGNACNNRT